MFNVFLYPKSVSLEFNNNFSISCSMLFFL